MKTIFDKKTNEAILHRIEKLNKNSIASWGKMNVYEMLKHSIASEKTYLGDNVLKRVFIGKLFGRMALKNILKDEKPMGKNSPTHPTFIFKGEGDISPLKREWSFLVQEYLKRDSDDFQNFTHPFFGKMTQEQLGQMVYKHIDHHLRQFKV